jgi:hypothetical protein
MMNRPLVFLVAMAGLTTFPVHGQWCEAIPDPFPPDPQIEWDTQAKDIPVIEVLAMVLPEAGAPEGVRPHLEAGVQHLNQVLANSEVPGIVRLLGVIPAPPSQRYQPAEARDILAGLANDPEVKRLRDELGADLVTLIVPQDIFDPPTGGTAYTSNSPSLGYSAMTIELLDGYPRLFSHELGHNLGLPHDLANASHGGPYAPQAYGHWGQFPDGTWFRDTMSYLAACPGGCSVEVPFFSNPDVTYRGVPMGIRGEREAATFLKSDAMRRVEAYRPSKAGDCVSTPTTLCLGGARFRVEATWDSGEAEGEGHAVALTADTGYFWFFTQANVEVIVKVLNGCGVNNRYWVFAGGLTNVGVTLTVTDTVKGTTETYTNAQGRAFAPIQDTGALATCP